jgi:tetratricopeptide (TPR) repeat protein
MTPPSKITNPADIAVADAQASKHMKEGIRLLGESPGNVQAALGCFDRALELRSRLPIEVAAYAYGLAACWLNRAEALTHLGNAAHRELAREAYDEAIALLRTLRLRDDARFSKRLAIALQNRALALVAHDPSATTDAAHALSEAIGVLDEASGLEVRERDYLLAVVWMNLANVRASEATAAADISAQHAARRTLALVASREQEDEAVAEAGLKARHVMCQTIARQLSTRAPGDTTMPDDVHEATDLADEGLSIVRNWERVGVARFRHLASDLFRFGARVYLRYQPHFLSEFVRENMDPRRSSRDYVESSEMRDVAAEVPSFLDAPGQ